MRILEAKKQKNLIKALPLSPKNFTKISNIKKYKYTN